MSSEKSLTGDAPELTVELLGTPMTIAGIMVPSVGVGAIEPGLSMETSVIWWNDAQVND